MRSFVASSCPLGVPGDRLPTDAFAPLLNKSFTPRLIYVTNALGSIALRLNPPNPPFNAETHHYRMSKAAFNTLAACHRMLFKQWGRKVWSFCPGFVITNLTGEGAREWRKQNGALQVGGETSAELQAAEGILEMVDGARDADVGLFVHRRDAEVGGPDYSDGIYPW